ncbi:MAG: membrane dipeptidase [Pseudomonadota bacterium]
MAAASRPSFDGHNDALLKLWRAEQKGEDPVALFRDGCSGHLDTPRMRAGGMTGGFFAVFVPNEGLDLDDMEAETSKDGYDLPLPPELSYAEAAGPALQMAGILMSLQRNGLLRVCRSAAEIEAANAAGELAAVLHLEGAEAIDREFRALDLLEAAGLKSIGPVWSRPTAYGAGVPFRFPSGPDTGPGLTEAGRALMAECSRRRLMVDLSHITEAGFWDVAEAYDGPLVATHSNAHEVTPHARNLTDKQLDAIRERDGIVGLNYATGFLREDGRMVATDTLDDAVRHMSYLVERLGEDRVGLGSDFDGALIPSPIGDAAGLPALEQALSEAQFGDALIDKIFRGNWMRALKAVWGE